jgi:hypothetical protein
VVVDQVQVESIALLEAHDQSPVAGPAQAPMAGEIAFEGVGAPARQRRSRELFWPD